MRLLHPVLIFVYFALPAVAGIVAAVRARRADSPKPYVAFAVTCFSAGLIGSGLNLLYAIATDARAQVLQVLLTCYLLVGVLSLLKGLSWLLREGTERALRVRRPAGGQGQAVGQGPPRPPAGWGWVARATGAILVRGVLLAALGLPYVMAVGMVFRPKVVGADDPRKQLSADFQPVGFASADGTPLSGWWIPATDRGVRGATTRPAGWGTKTVILCHGLGANKANQLALARDLLPAGYNVLSFDFRAHGESGGQFSTFGDLERLDVLGAVRWVRAHRPEQAKRLVGLGISMGAAALLAAAADDGPDGRALDAVAVYSTYGDLAAQANHSLNFRVPLVGWLVRRVGVPLASLHAGTDLEAFAPARLVDRLGPRPLLVIHGRGDLIIPFDAGAALFDGASQPKLRFWIGKLDEASGKYLDRYKQPADHVNVMYNDDAAKAVLLFFEGGRAVM